MDHDWEQMKKDSLWGNAMNIARLTARWAYENKVPKADVIREITAAIDAEWAEEEGEDRAHVG